MSLLHLYYGWDMMKTMMKKNPITPARAKTIYRGKYPRRIREVWTKNKVLHVTLNDGTIHKMTAGAMPKVGENYDDLIHLRKYKTNPKKNPAPKRKHLHMGGSEIIMVQVKVKSSDPWHLTEEGIFQKTHEKEAMEYAGRMHKKYPRSLIRVVMDKAR